METKLTQEQQQIIQDSMWVVNTVLKQQGLQGNEDWRSTATLYMCQCLLRFDETQNIKWTTYAYKSVFLYMKRVVHKEMYSNSLCVSSEKMYYMTAEDNLIDAVSRALYMDSLTNKLTKRELFVFKKKRQGNTSSDIAKAMHLSITTVNNLWRSIKQKARDMYEQERNNNENIKNKG